MKNNKYIIACDCDDVLNNLCEQTCETYNSMYQDKIYPENFTSFDISKCFEHDVVGRIFDIWNAPSLNIWRRLSPPALAIPSVQELCANDNILFYVATATFPSTAEIKLKWLSKYYGVINESNYIVIQHKTLLTPAVDFIIDDNLGTLIDCDLATHKILINRPWNQQSVDMDEIYGIVRVKDMNEAKERILEIIQEEGDYFIA